MKSTTIARCPTYDDSGDAANGNIVKRWDFEGFWNPCLDETLDRFGGDKLSPRRRSQTVWIARSILCR